ncbi:D-aminoacyl-tRNA deacylase [Lingula anatina]|uniref:D-aminoacyl-tRNA deacylase n=1 Tax=Lingula anatina TaxID=7574 RepID=A0A1S3J8J8_LINAN|nr:D-aminoacyl-tRNA deacylase [Lingula anatina]|eukprot:XP_013406551.1 D-aminoacyl-tRNA deacylase [Lingula anatina]
MRAVIQRVMKASVSVDGEIVSSIDRGLCVLLGISHNDTPKEFDYMVRKILNLRLFDDDQGKRWMKSVKDKNFEVLCVSQFTLYHVLKGNKPDFHNAMGGEAAEAFYQNFLKELGKAYDHGKIKDGKFGAYMQVHIQNDGPVTITLDSPAQTQEPKGALKGKQKREKTAAAISESSVAKQNTGSEPSLAKPGTGLESRGMEEGSEKSRTETGSETSGTKKGSDPYQTKPETRAEHRSRDITIDDSVDELASELHQKT